MQRGKECRTEALFSVLEAEADEDREEPDE
jgi:hypothetical protein